MDRKYLFVGFFFTALILLLWAFYLIIEPFLLPIFWAATLAVVFFPVQERLTRQLGGRKGLAAALVTVIILLVLLVPLTMIATTLGGEIVEAYTQFENYIKHEDMTARVRQFLGLFPSTWMDFAENRLNIETLSSPERVQALLDRTARLVIRLIPTGAKGFLKGIAYLAILIFTLFFFLRDGPGLAQNIKSLIPMNPEQKDRIFHRFYEILNSVITGVLTTATVQATLIVLLFLALGLPFPILAGVVTFLGGVLPIGGASLAWLPGSIILFAAGDTLRGGILLGVGALLISTVDNILKPMIIGGKAKLPTVFLFFSILGGIKLFGFTGIILGPVVLAIILSFLDIYRREYHRPEPAGPPRGSPAQDKDAARPAGPPSAA
ncbi:MAG: AI-2E family transporter [Nitrospirae bacterium]|nr:AI-2E family transporter [Nitrospirota bacterium]